MTSREIPEISLLLSPKARQKLATWALFRDMRTSRAELVPSARHGERVAVSACYGVGGARAWLRVELTG